VPKRDIRFLRPWGVGAGLWLALSLIVSREYLRSSDARQLLEVSGLLSLLWLQFGFAGLFHRLVRGPRRQVFPLFLTILCPPLLLLLLDLLLAWWLGKVPPLSWP
jgi:hypothetical protein